MNRIANVARLQMNKREVTFLVPASIVAIVLVVTAIIAIALQRAGLDPNDPGYAEGARHNAGMVWSLPGFLVYYGVQAVSTTFPFAMALGATRRDYVVGTAFANVVTSLYIAAIMTLLLWIELATGHWFIDIYALDVYLLGSGNALVLAATVFLGSFAAMSIGGVFAAVWVRYGNKGPTVLGLGVGLLLAVFVLVMVPYAAQIFAGFTATSAVWIALAISLVSILGTWLAMRQTAVR